MQQEPNPGSFFVENHQRLMHRLHPNSLAVAARQMSSISGSTRTVAST